MELLLCSQRVNKEQEYALKKDEIAGQNGNDCAPWRSTFLANLKTTCSS